MRVGAKVWLERSREGIIGGGRALLLQAIEEYGSIAEAARRLGISYRHAWNELRRMEEVLGKRIVKTRVGGKSHGSTALTKDGERLLNEYMLIAKPVEIMSKDKFSWQNLSFKISARNRIRGIVKSIEIGDVAAKVEIEVKGSTIITSLITRDAAEHLELREGDEVEAVIKATEVMIGKR